MTKLKHPKAKGTRFEKEIVEAFKDAGYEAERMWGSNGQSRGLHQEVDVLVKNFMRTGQYDRSYPEPSEYVQDCNIQCKFVNRLAEKYKPSEQIHATVFRENHGETYILMRLTDFLIQVS